MLRSELDQTALRLGSGRVLVTGSYRFRAELGPVSMPRPAEPSAVAHGGRPAIQVADRKLPLRRLMVKPVVVLVEAVTCDAGDLALTVAAFGRAAGLAPGLVSLDPHNRLGEKFGHDRTPSWVWKQANQEFGIPSEAGLLVPGPGNENELAVADVERVVCSVLDRTDMLVVDLGCRWAPRTFRPILSRATHVWVVARPGHWTAVETRLEQAEFSGWTDMNRVKVVVQGTGLQVPGTLSSYVGAVLPDLTCQMAREFVSKEVGGLK